MPAVPDLGLDAAFVQGGGEIVFALPEDVFSETLGPIQHGDLLSQRGYIVKRNQDLLGAFSPTSSSDAGLDAVQVMRSGEILFSIQTNMVSKSGAVLSRGDILSDHGNIFMGHQQLLSNFQPALTNHDFGLDAFYVFSSGEIWFSVEEPFTDKRLGPIQSGDLLSNLGYRVFSNQSLLEPFAPAAPSTDYGLDALFVVTDTERPLPAPRITKIDLSEKRIHLEWEGEGAVFQVETSADFFSPWVPFSQIIPDTMFEAEIEAASADGFFRLQQR